MKAQTFRIRTMKSSLQGGIVTTVLSQSGGPTADVTVESYEQLHAEVERLVGDASLAVFAYPMKGERKPRGFDAETRKFQTKYVKERVDNAV